MTTYHEVTPSVEEQERIDNLRKKHRLQFEKEKTALKFYMLGKGYHLGLKALGFLETYSLKDKDGVLKLRKDKTTPEMHHMIRIAFSATQLRGIQDEETCIILALLHDVQEDEDVDSPIIERDFGKTIAEKNWKLTKKFAGQHKNAEMFYHALSEDREASIDKGLDRCDNLENMIGVFGMAKIRDYCDEAENVYLPMLHRAAKLFPEQQIAYHAIRQRMKRAIAAGRHIAFLMECQGRQKEQILDLTNQVLELNQEKSDLTADQQLSADKLYKAYLLTNSNTYEEHKKKIEALIANTINLAKGEGVNVPEELDHVEQKHKRDLYVKLQVAMWNKIKSRTGDISKAKILFSEMCSAIQTELGVSSLELAEYPDPTLPIPADNPPGSIRDYFRR